MTKETLKQFFADRKAISVSAFCREADITTTTLNFIIDGKRKIGDKWMEVRLTDEVKNKLLPVLKKYGYDKTE